MDIKSVLRSVLFFGVLMAASPFSNAEKLADFDPLTATIEENLSWPKVSTKQHDAVVSEMKVLQKALTSAKYNATAVRSGEVIMVTIPCSRLFKPNETTLSPKAGSVLSPLVNYVRDREKYKVIIAVHTDDTGDQTYADRITDERAEAIDEYFSKLFSGNETGIIPYGLGKDEPVAPNTSISRRSSNRRVEIYFVPTEATIRQAKKR